VAQVLFWALGIGAGLAMLVVSAAARPSGIHMAYLHMAIAAAVSTGFALAAIGENMALRRTDAAKSVIAASTARHMGLVWMWGALVLAVTYATGVLTWRDWWQFFLAFAVAAGLCLAFSATLDKDARAGREDASMLRVGRYLAIVQLVGMLIAVLGLLIDGKMTRLLNPRYTDWAANDVFFFGAIAVAVISANALRANRS
jgi:hypothetical protein